MAGEALRDRMAMTEKNERRGTLRAIGAELQRVAGPVLGKRGLGEAQLIAQWSAVIGTQLAAATLPVKLSFPPGERRNGTLRLRVSSAAALEVQHREPQILERINGFFGYAAVARLALVQGPLPALAGDPPPQPRPLTPAERTAIEGQVAAVPDSGLRAALERLGAAILGNRRR